MDLISKLNELEDNIDKIDKLTQDMLDSLDQKTTKINFLKEEIELNIKKIDEIITEYNANT
mgnify:CR=1 FL=1|tara:strand:- start:964 stop:1146 length:183 start_codon:yes stop_codon:yes gene_type:complete